MMVVHLYSPDKSRDSLFISNYATLAITDTLTRIDGVGSITVFGSRDYSMRIWADPDRLQTVGLTASDVVLALQAQNVQVAGGVLDQAPMPKQGAFQFAVQTLGRLANPDEFANIVVKRLEAPWSASRTWRGSSSPPRTTRRIPISTAIRRCAAGLPAAGLERWRRRRRSSPR